MSCVRRSLFVVCCVLFDGCCSVCVCCVLCVGRSLCFVVLFVVHCFVLRCVLRVVCMLLSFVAFGVRFIACCFF